MSGSDWHASELAGGFDAFDGSTERAVGFPILFRELGLGTPAVRTLLDYGCGPGKIATEVADRFDLTVTGVDVSAPMLRIATEQRAHPRVRYRQLDESRLDFLGSDSIDAAMSCFVLINVGEPDELRAIAAAVHRVLRPGGRYVIMDSNPDATGVRFTSFQTGEPGRAYAPGDTRRVDLFGSTGHYLELVDFHWPATTYEEVLRAAGFGRVAMTRPRLTYDGPGTPPAEARTPPLLIVTATK